MLARLLSLASITGILDELGGEGLTFQELEAPFTLESGIINLKNAKAGGWSLGITASGIMDKEAETLDININSHFYYTKHAIPLLKNNKTGSIINLSSTAGLFGFPLRSPYAASKWAVIGMTKTLAMELGKFNIRVNAICPGSVSGDRMKRVIEAKAKSLGLTVEKVQKEFESYVSLGKFVDKEDIANVAVFLLSEEAHKITGQVMTIDGHTERMN